MYPVLDAKATEARIKELRKAHNLKVEEVARFMGLASEIKNLDGKTLLESGLQSFYELTKKLPKQR